MKLREIQENLSEVLNLNDDFSEFYEFAEGIEDYQLSIAFNGRIGRNNILIVEVIDVEGGVCNFAYKRVGSHWIELVF